MRVLRRNGNDLNWQLKLVSEWDADDDHHQNAMRKLAEDIFELADTRNYYIDRETLLKMYNMYMSYDTTVVPQWKQNQVELWTKITEENT